MQYYRKILDLLEDYFHENDWKKYFLTGGCYWLADYLHQGIAGSVIMINRIEEHCALYFDYGLYDVTGKISKINYRAAGDKEISFMKKNYIPKFDTHKLQLYLSENSTAL